MTLLPDPLETSLLVLMFWGMMAVLGFFILRISRTFLSPLLFLLAAGGVTLASSGLSGLTSPADLHRVVPGGLPGLPFHFRQDPLSSFFLLLLGGAATGILIFSA
ncbi:MAG: hypothetical protein M0T83_09065, partial [Nitrospiraceae bacterium]|nr:hypothetical protein [Nitrospiraceae bacterium]